MNSEPELALIPDFVLTADLLFEHLTSILAWDEQIHGGKTASFGEPYNSGQTNYPEAAFPARIGRMLDVLEMELGFLPNNCFANYNSNGESDSGLHFDTLELLEEGTGIAIISLGDERHLTFHRHDDNRVETSIVLPNGSLLYLPFQVQNEWFHRELTQQGSKGYLSLTFRRLK